MNKYLKQTALAIALAAASASAISAQINVGVAGKYKFITHKADAEGQPIPGTEKVAADWFDNLITNYGMDLLGTQVMLASTSSGAPWYACRVGTGSTPAANTDNALVSQLASTTTINANVSGASGTAPYYGWYRRTFRFAAGAAAGNISEVGVGSATTGATLFSRALIVDGSGNPITLTILPDEILDVVYEYRMYPPAADIAWGPLTISGVSYSGLIRPSYVTSTATQRWVPYTTGSNDAVGLLVDYGCNAYAYSTDVLGAVTGVPAGGTTYPLYANAANGLSSSGSTAASYASGTYYRDHTLRIDLNYGNVPSGIGSLNLMSSMGAWQISFTPKVPKTASHRFNLGLRFSWARHVF